jgi:hypothetical protein
MCRRNRSLAPYFEHRVLALANYGRRQAGNQLSQFLSLIKGDVGIARVTLYKLRLTLLHMCVTQSSPVCNR